ALLDVRSLEVAYGGIQAVKGLDLHVAEGELVCLIGANGAGKTTTLKGICGLQPVKRGEIFYSGENITGMRSFELVRRGLAMAPALMSRPKLLLLDEPSMGLAPLMVQKVFETIRAVSAEGVTMLLIEQNAKLALEVSHRGYVMESGEVTLAGSARDLLDDP